MIAGIPVLQACDIFKTPFLGLLDVNLRVAHHPPESPTSNWGNEAPKAHTIDKIPNNICPKTVCPNKGNIVTLR